MKKAWLKTGALLACVWMTAAMALGCASGAAENKTEADAVDDGLGKPENSGEPMELYVLNWGDYMDEEVLAGFTAEYPNIDLNYETFASNEEMLVQIQNGSIYDICFPSDYTIQKMIQLDLLQPIDHSRLPHLANIDERFMDLSFDPGNQYSIPYMWGTVGILYNTTMVEGEVDSWNVLWDEKYSKQIFMYDSVRDSIAVALRKLGYSSNTKNQAELDEAEAALIAQKPLVLAYGLDDLRDKMIGGSGALAVVYAGDAIASIDENPDLAYSVPQEGSNIWFDNVVITKTSKNTEAAYIFIDYLLRAGVAKRNTEYIGYSTPNKAAFELLDDGWKENEVYNPPQEVIDRCEVFEDLGDFVTNYNDAWLRIKAAK